jgi:hypothetical protein
MSGESDTVRLEATWGDFVANVSHELKTPVGAVTLLAEGVLHVAANHGGDVQLWSKPGTGSTFTCGSPRIPTVDNTRRARHQHSSTRDGRDDLVLIVEDSGSIADMLTFLLTRRHPAESTVNSGRRFRPGERLAARRGYGLHRLR